MDREEFVIVSELGKGKVKYNGSVDHYLRITAIGEKEFLGVWSDSERESESKHSINGNWVPYTPPAEKVKVAPYRYWYRRGIGDSNDYIDYHSEIDDKKCFVDDEAFKKSFVNGSFDRVVKYCRVTELEVEL